MVQNKTGAEQVKAALSKAEQESNLAAKSQGNNTLATNTLAAKTFLNASSTKGLGDEKLDKMIESKVQQLDKLRKRHTSVNNTDESEEDEGSSSEANGLSASLRKTEHAEKENSELEEASDDKMVNMAKKLNNLVSKFQKKIGKCPFRAKDVCSSFFSAFV